MRVVSPFRVNPAENGTCKIGPARVEETPYFAERVAADLINIPDIDVSVSHTAQQYWKTIAKESA